MVQQCAFLLIGIHPLGYLFYKIAGLFEDCEPILVVNNVDPNLLRNPSQLQLEPIRRAYQVQKGGCGIGKRVNHQGELVDGFEVVHLLRGVTEADIGIHPDLAAFMPEPLPLFEPESPAPLQEPIGGLPDPVGLQAPDLSDKVVDTNLLPAEEPKHESVDDVLATELSSGEPQGDGSGDAGGNQPRAITVGKGSKR